MVIFISSSFRELGYFDLELKKPWSRLDLFWSVCQKRGNDIKGTEPWNGCNQAALPTYCYNSQGVALLI